MRAQTRRTEFFDQLRISGQAQRHGESPAVVATWSGPVPQRVPRRHVTTWRRATLAVGDALTAMSACSIPPRPRSSSRSRRWALRDRQYDLSRAVLHYQPQAESDGGQMRIRITELAAQRRRFGYRRIQAQLRGEGARVNIKRVHRLYGEEKLQVQRPGDATGWPRNASPCWYPLRRIRSRRSRRWISSATRSSMAAGSSARLSSI
jgi:hypothetical protein